MLAKTAKKVPAVWKGFVMMQSIAKFGTSAYRVSGPCDDLLQLLPDTLHVQGRIAHEQVWDYLQQLKSSTSRVRTICVHFLKLLNFEFFEILVADFFPVCFFTLGQELSCQRGLLPPLYAGEK